MDTISTFSVEGISKPISSLVLGTAFYDLANKDHWFEILDEFQSHGGTTLDSGRRYGDSETVIGAWLKSKPSRVRDRMVLITKCGHGDKGIIPENNMETVFDSELKQSQERLETEYVDLYMLHRDNANIPVARIMDCLNRYVDTRRVRALGASNWTYPRIRRANDYARMSGLVGFSAVSNHLSLAVSEESFYPGLVTVDTDGEQWHSDTKIPLIPWSAQARGFFTGVYSPEDREAALGNGEFVKRMYKIYGTESNFERLKRATELGRMKGYTAMEVALRWLVNKPYTIAPIIGPHSREELRSCIKALSLVLTEEECKWLYHVN